MRKLLLIITFTAVLASLTKAQQTSDPRVADLVHAGKIRVGIGCPLSMRARALQSPRRCKPCPRLFRSISIPSPGPSGTHTIPRLCRSALSRSLGGSAVHGKDALNVADGSIASDSRCVF
jgi:hypothetical protein